MAADLSGLERAAARAGLPGLKARLVTPDPRRSEWFRWKDGELQVSEQVLDRCRPEDAEALLVDTIFEQRRLARRRARWGVVFLVTVSLHVTLGRGSEAGLLHHVGFTLAYLALLVCAIVDRQRVRLQADDETVALLGDAEALVRALNGMNQEEMHFGKVKMPARPDLHARAERLVQKHRLCSGVVPEGVPEDGPGPPGGHG